MAVPWREEDSQPLVESMQEAGRRAAVMTAALAKQALLSFSGQDIQGQPGAGPGGTSSLLAESVLAQSTR